MSENMEHARWLIIDTYTMHIKLGLNPILGLGISERSMCIWNSSYFHNWQLFFEFFSFFQQLHARLSYSTLCISFHSLNFLTVSMDDNVWTSMRESRWSIVRFLLQLPWWVYYCYYRAFFHICCASIPSRTLFLLHA